MLDIGSATGRSRASPPFGQSIVWADTVNLNADTVGQCVEQLVRRIAAAALPKLHEDVMRNFRPASAVTMSIFNKLRMRSVGESPRRGSSPPTGEV